MTSPKAAKIWATWCANAKRDAEARWDAVKNAPRGKLKGKDWQQRTYDKLIELEKLEILAPREHLRLTPLGYDNLEPAHKRRLVEHRRNLYVYGIKPPKEDETEKQTEKNEDHVRLSRNSLRLNDGKRLRKGRLGLLVFVDDATWMPVGMSIQLRGQDPARSRALYLRYDLDVVPLGSGPVTHFSSHWHMGDDPDAKDAEDHDPRLPALILDPLAVIDILVETFWPKGPEDVADP